jgi:hypothetical protein
MPGATKFKMDAYSYRQLQKASAVNRRASASVALIGGIDRLRNHYIAAAEKSGVDLRFFSQDAVNIGPKIMELDALVIFTGMISHQAKKKVMRVAKSRHIPVLMSHSCGVCSLKQCIDCLINKSLSSASL